MPFARTRAEREAAGDPRPSLEERYGTQEGYVCAVRRAADRLVRDRYLLPDDAAAPDRRRGEGRPAARVGRRLRRRAPRRREGVPMTLALAGLLTIAALLALILTKRASPLVALILVPVVAALATGAGMKTGTYILQGIGLASRRWRRCSSSRSRSSAWSATRACSTRSSGACCVLVGTNPVRIMIGHRRRWPSSRTSTGTARSPFSSPSPRCCRVFERLGHGPPQARGDHGLAAGVSFLPWTGPTIRAAAALEADHARDLRAADSRAGRRDRLHLRRGLVVGAPGGEAAAGVRRRGPAPARPTR